jgi:phosphatidylinositol alpha 1,6-mannosyltransferase
MRIALFTETFTPQRNGVALILARLARFLVEQRHEVLVVTAARDPNAAAVRTRGIEVVRLRGVAMPFYPDLTVSSPVAPRAVARVRRFQPDVIHLATEYAVGLVGLQIARALEVPALSSFHTNIPAYLPHYGFGWASETSWRYLRWFHARATHMYCPSHVMRAELVRRGFARVRVWGRGVDTARFSPAHRCESLRARLGPADSVRLLYVGRLTPEKGLPDLFTACRWLVSDPRAPPMHLGLVGGGALAGRIVARAPANATWMGYLDGEALSRTYASSDLFVFPSRTETLGNVVLEALASGLPVVAPADGGVLETVEHGANGLLFTPGDTRALARAVLRLAGDSAVRAAFGRRARASVLSRTWASSFQPLVAGYQELAAA